MAVVFETDGAALQAKHAAAMAGLRGNVTTVFGYDKPVLIEGAEYPGAWLECAPMEALIYGVVSPAVAIDTHRLFFTHQRADGYLPCFVWKDRVGASQIQMVVPIAKTAYETYLLYGDRDFLQDAYEACAKWDAWLARYRNTRGTGCCEAFCEYDTGHDNSPRFAGLPHQCDKGDARLCITDRTLPLLAPDLSATLYGGRMALASMAASLGLSRHVHYWLAQARAVREAILAYCFSPADMCFYDLEAEGRFIRIRGDAISRVLCEGVAGGQLFEEVYRRQIHSEQAFWTPYPMPSIAADDPAFVREMPANSWGGTAQALTALRAPRWFDAYGKSIDLAHLMRQWLKALCAAKGFMQQMNPWTGEFIPSQDGYSPSMLATIDFTSRLHGVRVDCAAPYSQHTAKSQGAHAHNQMAARTGGGTDPSMRLEWSCTLPAGATQCRYETDTPRGKAELIQQAGQATLKLAGKEIGTATGNCRIVTDMDGKWLSTVNLLSEFTPGQFKRA
jgi:hypothetical protein